MVHLLPHWNWENKELASKVADSEGKIPVRAYSNASSVELFLNGKSLGLKTFNKNKPAMGGLTKKVQMLMNFILNGKLPINQVPWKQLLVMNLARKLLEIRLRLLVSQRQFVLLRKTMRLQQMEKT